MRRRMSLLSMIAAALLFCGANAWAATASALMQVSVTVAPNCRISVTDLAFGTYDPIVANSDRQLDATADLRMVCTKGAQAAIMIDSGRNGSHGSRSLSSGTELVTYDLFRDSARTQRWADADNALHVVATGGKDPQLFTVFGRVPPGQEVPPGVYYDVITATVDF